MLEKFERMALLKDFYGPLLTERQQEVMNLHYDNDFSLSEIADSLEISRQAVYDFIKRAEAALEDYESRLNLVDRFLNNRKVLQQTCELLQEEKGEQGSLDKALQMLRQLVETV